MSYNKSGKTDSRSSRTSYDGDRRSYTPRNPEKMSSMQEQYEKDFDYAATYAGLEDKDDMRCSPEVLKMQCESFDLMNGEEGLKEDLLRSIYAYGFEIPSRIQCLAIPQIISGREMIAQSQSGTGKTGAFVISSLQIIKDNLKKPQVILLSPTSELAQQTYLVAKHLSALMNGVNCSFSVGGADRQANIEELGGGGGLCNTPGCQIVVATPGRLKDLIESNNKLFEHIRLVIVDECDELLNGTFKEDMRQIISLLPADLKMSFFSATYNASIVALAKVILKDPVEVYIKKEKTTLEGIAQTYIEVPNHDSKVGVLMEMFSVLPLQQFIIYVNSIKNSDILKTRLEKESITVMSIDSSNNKYERADIIRRFKKGDIKCLISTDLLARGIDIQQLSLVVNYDLPKATNIQSYIHRIGRTGRCGKKGLAINLVTPSDKEIQSLISLTFKCSITPLKKDFYKDL